MSKTEQKLRDLAIVIAERPMTLQDAGNILRKVGVNTQNLDDTTVQKAMQTNPKVANVIQAAYQLFKSPSNKPRVLPNKPQTNDRAPRSSNAQRAPTWAVDSDWTIHKEDLSDPNFARKYIWELSGKPETAPTMTLWTFDGHKFTHHLAVKGSTKVFRQMAQVMVKLGGETTQAVFLAGGSDKLLLIYVDGRVLPSPIPMAHKSANQNPANDWDFVNGLPRVLASITKKIDGQIEEQGKDFKAWINSKTHKVEEFDVGKSFYDPLRDDPNTFGIRGVISSLQARLTAEREGWCAVGINSQDGEVAAVITAMNSKQALQAARILFKQKWHDGPWTKLQIKTNDTNFTVSSNNQMREYLLKGKVPTKDYLDLD
jgi:hypothetical protein